MFSDTKVMHNASIKIYPDRNLLVNITERSPISSPRMQMFVLSAQSIAKTSNAKRTISLIQSNFKSSITLSKQMFIGIMKKYMQRSTQTRNSHVITPRLSHSNTGIHYEKEWRISEIVREGFSLLLWLSLLEMLFLVKPEFKGGSCGCCDYL